MSKKSEEYSEVLHCIHLAKVWSFVWSFIAPCDLRQKSLKFCLKRKMSEEMSEEKSEVGLN
jgi:hypothetical protein